MKKGNIIWTIVLIIAIIVFLFSAYKLITIFAEYYAGEKEYESILEEVVSVEVVEEKGEEENASETKEKVVYKVDFDKLLSTNKETVGWIRFEQPEIISYPVVKGEDNDKYLKTTFEGKKNGSGAIFMDSANSGDFSDRNTFIYGHNMKNGSMFGLLREYKKKSFCEENPFFYIYTPDGREVKYQVFAVCIVEDTADSYQKIYGSDEEYLDYLKHVQSISRYDMGVELTSESQIVSLSTCTNVTETQRLLVHGVKVSETMVGE